MRLQSRDGSIFEVEPSAMRLSSLIHDVIECCDSPEEELVPLPTVSSEMLAKVIDFCQAHGGVAPEALPAPLPSDDLAECGVSRHDCKLLDIPAEGLFELLRVAKYLDMESLTSLTLAKLASSMMIVLPEGTPVLEEDTKKRKREFDVQVKARCQLRAARLAVLQRPPIDDGGPGSPKRQRVPDGPALLLPSTHQVADNDGAVAGGTREEEHFAQQQCCYSCKSMYTAVHHFYAAVAPFVLNSRLLPLLKRSPHQDRYVVNVSAMEGKFNRQKTCYHPHTNMAKAALNMMTRTCAQDLARTGGVLMTSVDTGWINDEHPLEEALERAERGFQTPLDEVDAAARVLDPVLMGVRFVAAGGCLPRIRHHQGQQRDMSLGPVWGVFLKDYQPTDW